MQPGNFFYVIMRNGQIFEIAYSMERFSAAMQALSKKDIFSVPSIGILAVNGADISEVLDDRQFLNYVSIVKPAEYPRYGTWFNKKGEYLRYDPWKQQQIDKRKQVAAPAPEKELTPEEQEKVTKRLKEFYYKSFPQKRIIHEQPSGNSTGDTGSS